MAEILECWNGRSSMRRGGFAVAEAEARSGSFRGVMGGDGNFQPSEDAGRALWRPEGHPPGIWRLGKLFSYFQHFSISAFSFQLSAFQLFSFSAFSISAFQLSAFQHFSFSAFQLFRIYS
jgi:hypothetical protein